jgi:hypothetical protein
MLRLLSKLRPTLRLIAPSHMKVSDRKFSRASASVKYIARYDGTAHPKYPCLRQRCSEGKRIQIDCNDYFRAARLTHQTTVSTAGSPGTSCARRAARSCNTPPWKRTISSIRSSAWRTAAEGGVYRTELTINVGGVMQRLTYTEGVPRPAIVSLFIILIQCASTGPYSLQFSSEWRTFSATSASDQQWPYLSFLGPFSLAPGVSWPR